MSKKDSHKDRMRMLDTIAAPPDGTPELAWLKEQAKSNPKLQQEASRRYKIARASVRAQLNSGAGRFADEALRQFLAEYNHRAWHYGLRRLPMSFNVLEAFFEYEQENIHFRLLPEIDYLFSVEDFLDFATRPDTPQMTPDAALDLNEGIIYNFSAYDDPTALSMQVDDGLEYVIAGVSMLRRGPELTVLLVVGEKGQLERLQKSTWEDRAKYSEVTPDESLPNEPIMLKGATDYVKAYAACRFDLKAMTLQVRYLMQDAGRYFVVDSDDPDGLAPLSEEKRAERLRVCNERLNTQATLWEVAKTAVLLPSYIRARIEFVKDEPQVTALGAQARNSLKVRKALDAIRPDTRILYRHISAIRIIRSASPAPAAIGRAYTPPLFQVPVQGFWRVFTDSSRTGHDEQGNPITGKTWVRSYTRYADRPEAPKVVYIKSSLAYARRQLEAYRKRMIVEELSASKHGETPAASQSAGAVPAYLYVLRSPAHGRDIYKVGYTERDPETRAQELSSASGNPVPFLVVQAWAVGDGHAAEVAAHEALANFRLASNREFFIGQYALLRERIEVAIEDWVIK